MFNIFNSNGSSGQLTSSSIKEANEQLQAMHRRISDLEQRISEQIELLNRREEENKHSLNQLRSQKDAEIKQVKGQLMRSEEAAAKMQGIIKERDVQIAFLLHRCSYLDEAASYAPLLDQLSDCMKRAFVAPTPKVQTVKPTRPGNPAASKVLGQQQQQQARSATATGRGSQATTAEEGVCQNDILQPARNQIIQTTNRNSGTKETPLAVSYGVPIGK